MTGRVRARISAPAMAATVAVGVTLGGLLVGFVPVGADPDGMYRPIKGELANALERGTLPFWSDHLGLGVPLVAESHVAAFYPPNWAMYRATDVGTAYRLAMWLHGVATALATFAYARSLGLNPWGGGMAALAFSLCGFQAVHSGHEPFYTLMPFLPLCLLAADRYAEEGRAAWLAALALAWGAQLCVGHFQIQMWTGGLALLTGTWRVIADKRPIGRASGIALALAWGAGVAAVQLGLTWELVGISGFRRPFNHLIGYAFPPGHLAQLALPGLFLQLRGSSSDPYWSMQATGAGEATLYVGTVPLILAFVGFAARKTNRKMAPWRWVVAASLVVATMPRWWPEGYWLVTLVPGLGWFRCPARYTVVTSLGLALLAGHGLDRAIPTRTFGKGVILAVLFGAAALAWGLYLAQQPRFRASFGEDTLPMRFGSAGVAWALGLVAIVAWRWRRSGAWGPMAVTAVELGVLYHLGPVVWDWAVPSPAQSPILRRLAEEGGVGLVAGPVGDAMARVGLTPAYPYLGITAPPPNYLLEASASGRNSGDREVASWMRRFGVSHGVWDSGEFVPNARTVFVGEDPVLDRLTRDPKIPVKTPLWKVVRYPGAWPAARAARNVRDAADWGPLYSRLVASDAQADVYYLPNDRPADSTSPRARSARVASWDGRTAVVEHDGACDLVIRRTYYPGWTARVDDGPARPVLKADAGLQAVRIDGTGTSRVTFSYRPTGLIRLAATSIDATCLALLVLAISATRAWRPRAEDAAGVSPGGP